MPRFNLVPCLRRQLIKFLSTEARRAGKLREKLEKVEVWTQQRRIPSSLTRRIRAYYAEIWLDYAGERVRLIRTVPPTSMIVVHVE